MERVGSKNRNLRAVELSALSTGLAVAKVAALAGGGALVDIAAIASKTTAGDVAAASVVNAVSALVKVAGSSLGFNVRGGSEDLRGGGGLGDSGGRDGDSEDSDESESLGEHFR